jgi:hypothetical protein
MVEWALSLTSEFLGDPNAIVSFLSVLVAIYCALLARSEARAKDKQSQLRQGDIQKFVAALEQIMRDHDRAPELIRRVRDETQTLVRRVKDETQELLRGTTRETKRASAELRGIFEALQQVTNVALRSQRDSAIAHRKLMKLICETDEHRRLSSDASAGHPSDPPDSEGTSRRD